MGYKDYFMKFFTILFSLLVCFQVSFAEDLVFTYSDDAFLYMQDEMVFMINQDNTAELTRYVGFSKTISIPDHVRGYPVTTIGSGAFCETKIQNITLPETIINIDEYSFFSSWLNEINVPTSVQKIGNLAFASSPWLEKVNIENPQIYIEKNPFTNCPSLKEINIPENKNLFFEDACLYDSSGRLISCLNSIANELFVIPNGVTKIDEYAFVSNFYKPQAIYIPDSLSIIENNYFYLCSSLKEVVVSSTHPTLYAHDGILFSKDENSLICYPAGNQSGAYSIPKSVEKIGKNAFVNTNLKTLLLSESVTYIDDFAFWNCKIDNLFIPSTVSYLGNCAVNNQMRNLTIAQDHDSYILEDGKLFSRDKTRLLFFSSELFEQTFSIPESVVTIDAYAFYDCKLKNICIPRQILEIGTGAFYGSDYLKTVEINAALRTIEDYLFYSCSSLVEVKLPSSIEYIGNHVFSGTALQHISIPQTVQRISSVAFLNTQYVYLTVNINTYGYYYAKKMGINYQLANTLDWLF